MKVRINIITAAREKLKILSTQFHYLGSEKY